MKKIRVNFEASLDLTFYDEIFHYLQQKNLLHTAICTTLNAGLNNVIATKMGDLWTVKNMSWEIVKDK